MKWKKALIGVAALAAVVGAWSSGLFELAKEPARLQAALRDLGPVGMLAYLGIFVLTQPLGMPGIALIIAASLIWPPAVAIALGLLGMLLSSSINFGFARSMGRDWVAARLPARFKVWDERIAQRGLITVITLRVLFFGNQIVNLLLGVSQLGYPTFLLGTAIGLTPFIVILVFFGPTAVDWISANVPLWAIAAGGVVIFVIYRLTRRVMARRAARAGVAPPGVS